jgi:hypothetical protein
MPGNVAVDPAGAVSARRGAGGCSCPAVRALLSRAGHASGRESAGQRGDEDAELITEPATMPWGNRSVLFRDPTASGPDVLRMMPGTSSAAARVKRAFPVT